MKLALITGASSGIGYALTQLLRKQGLRVVGASRDPERIDGESILYDLPTLIKFIQEHAPDVVIHAAGFGMYGSVLAHTHSRAQELFDVHVLMVLELAKALKEACDRHNKEGILLAISSAAGEMPTPGMALYGASKAAVTSLCLALDYELAPRVRVLVSCPGMVNTPFASRAAGRPYCYPRWVMSADRAAQLIWRQIIKRKNKTIIDWKYRIALLLLPFISNNFISRLIYKSIAHR